MGLFGSKVDCALCKKPFSKKEGKIFLDNGKGGVCGHCFEKWVAEGTKCAICHQGVHGTQEVSFLPQENSFGHYDCGGGMRVR